MTRMGAVMAVVVAAAVAGSAGAAEVAPVCRTWDSVSTPHTGKESVLTSVDALDASNVWAVGHEWNSPGTRGVGPLAIRWDGSTWAAEPLPDLSHLGSQPTLEAVQIAPTGDPWVVGRVRDSDGQNAPLILRWSRGFWEAHPVAMLDSFAPRFASLRDVAEAAKNDAWAVGEAETVVKGAIELFAAHWDGLAWSEVALPPGKAMMRRLTAVSAIAADAVWAVGYDVPDFRGTSYARIYRWDGRSWAIVDHPVAARRGSALQDIVALAADDIWAVGTFGKQGGLFLHWDGSSWTEYAAPPGFDPQSVDGVTSKDVWAAGTSGTAHWDGTNWTFLPSKGEARRAIAVSGPCDAWSVTTWSDPAGSSSAMERLVPSTPAPAPPATPLAFVAKATASTEIYLGWQQGDDPTGRGGQTTFVIERCVGEKCDDFIAVGKVSGTVTSYVDSGLKPETSYTYRIYAVNDAGNSESTEPVTALTPASEEKAIVPEVGPLPRPELPVTPVDFAAKTAGRHRIVLSWVPGGGPPRAIGATTFVIERCVGGPKPCETRIAPIVKVEGAVTSYIDVGLRPATAYTYRIYAINKAGKSEPSAPTTAFTRGARS